MSTKHAPRNGVRRRWLAAAAALTAVAVVAAGCGTGTGKGAGSGSGSKKVAIVGFSILKDVNAKATKAFEATSAGKGVTFSQSYGASGDQSRQVVAGIPADVVHFSLEGDITRLVDEKLVAGDWNAGPTKGIASQSVVVFVVRKGNPKNIKTWDDLIKPGVGIVTPNPGSSGSARWNILAGWAHATANGGSDADGKAYLKKFFGNVKALPGSGRDATSAFEGGVGDVLISYENEAIQNIAKGADLEYILPADTLLIQNPAAVTVSAPAAAKSFLDFIESAAGQKIYAENGFRPLPGVDVGSFTTPGANDPSNPYPAPSTKLFTIDDFGGWSVAAKKFFDEKTGIVTKIQAEAGAK
ncbi:MAG: sulfate ABC transporter substrate-binding protein [Marmoricola sp.]